MDAYIAAVREEIERLEKRAVVVETNRKKSGIYSSYDMRRRNQITGLRKALNIYKNLR